jgi:nitrite reductase (cytochrome c-552)
MKVNAKHLLFAAISALSLSLAACGSEEAADKKIDTGLSESVINNEEFKDKFPLQYESYMLNNEDTQDTKYSGSVKRSKYDHDKEPYLPILFNNYGFATEYNEDRGHTYAVEDVINVARINDASFGSCMTCKSTAVPQMIKEKGDNYWGGNFRKDIVPAADKLGHSPIGCSDCHNPKNMELRITRPSFVKAMKETGVDVSKATKNEMRSYVCAQCHVEYYFKSSNKEVTFPWSEGFKPEEMYKYYTKEKEAKTFEKDWVHGVSGAPMIKAQHPEFETWIEGTHGKNGVSCADCHMPYKRVDGKKISSHQWTSPLKSIENSCRTCHSDKTAAKLKDRVTEIQDTHMKALHNAEHVSIKAHYYVNKMITLKVSEAKIKEAQELVRKGQWFWDIVAAENSAGFHNPQGSMDSLRVSTDESNKAIQLATEELVKKGANLEEVNAEIEKAMKKVYDEKDNFKKKTHAVNTYFTNQAPPMPAPVKK